jgi:hypothetical protein
VSGFTDIANSNANNGQNILTDAITTAKGATPVTIPQELGGQTLVAGAYQSAAVDSSFTLSTGGTLTLNAQGNPDAVWIFQMDGSNPELTTTGGNIVFQDGIGNPCDVFWQVNSSATIADSTMPFIGNIMAGASITLGSGATVDGRVLASTAQVTLMNNTINGCSCPGQ